LTNLVCFSHYTAGGLLCDILNDTYSEIGSNGGIKSLHHSLGKISDSDTVLIDYDVEKIVQQISVLPSHTWAGTHCWPGKLPTDCFGEIINVTTVTHRSQCYRWLRSYYHYFSKIWKLSPNDMDFIDKCRETAKNYLVPFEPVWENNVVNIEFADIVENTAEFCKIAKNKDISKHMQRWKMINNFLYDSSLWSHQLVKIFYQAQLETELKRYYIYH
jgi:hypothetical protein